MQWAVHMATISNRFAAAPLDTSEGPRHHNTRLHEQKHKNALPTSVECSGLVGHTTRRPYNFARRLEGELIKDLLLPTPPRMWCRRTGGQLKTWATTIKADLELLSGPRVFGHTQWRKDWAKASSELAQDRRAWSTSVRGVINSIGDAGSTHPG